jgi:hypothetical protein
VSFALGIPVKYNDPSGHCVDGISTLACIAVAGFLIGGVVDAAIQYHEIGTIDGGEVLATAVATSAAAVTVAVAAPVVVGMAGEALMGVGLATGSTTAFSAGVSTYGAAGTLAAGLYGVNQACGGDCSDEAQNFASQMEPADAERYNNYWTHQPKAPEQSRPYYVHKIINENSDIHQVTTYDKFGYRYNQYDLDVAQWGEHYHPWYYSGTERRP